MDHDGSGTRRVVATLLALTAALALVVGAISLAAQRTVYETDHAGVLADQLLEEPGVRVAIAERLTDRAVVLAPGLRPDREALTQVAELLTTTPAFREPFTDAVSRLELDLKDGGAPEVVLRLDGMLAALRDGWIRTTGKRFEIPGGVLTGVIVVDRSQVEAFRRLDDLTRGSGWVSIAIGLLAAAGAIAVAERPRRAVFWVGAALAGGALLALIVMAVSRTAVVTQIDSTNGQAAAGAMWDVVAGSIRGAIVVVVLAGLGTAVAGLALRAYGGRGSRGPISG